MNDIEGYELLKKVNRITSDAVVYQDNDTDTLNFATAAGKQKFPYNE